MSFCAPSRCAHDDSNSERSWGVWESMGIRPHVVPITGGGPRPAATLPHKSHIGVRKNWKRTPIASSPVKSHRINGPYVFACSHNPQDVGSFRIPINCPGNHKNQ